MNLDIFEKSRELGELLVASDEYKKVQQAEEAFNDDEFAQKKVAEFNELQQSVQNMMQTPDPDQAAIAAEADRLRNLQAELIEMPSIKAMNDAQTEFSNLLTQVNQVLRFIITGQVDDGGCGGNCASCGGSCGSAHEHDEDCDCGHDHE